jgi:hypothetical protein
MRIRGIRIVEFLFLRRVYLSCAGILEERNYWGGCERLGKI